MKRVFSIVIIVVLAIIVITSVCLRDNPNADKRTLYEQFLLNEALKFDAQPSEKNNADHPEMASLQNYFMTLDPDLKRVPTERILEAYHYTIEQEEKNRNSSKGVMDWTEVGANMGGRTRALMFDPNDPFEKKVWAGSVTGGLWYNNDIYNNEFEWQPVNDFWPNLSVSCIVSDPIDSQIMYAGTGEYQTARVIYRESSYVGIGIWKSMDGGVSWELIPSTEDFKYISDLKIRIENEVSVIYAGVVSGTYKGVNHTSEPNDGLYRSSDGGETWEQVLPNIPGENLPFSPADLEIGPTGRIFVGTMKNLDGDGGASILYSDVGTAGTWTIFDDYEWFIQINWEYNIPGRVIIACSPSDPNRVYALVGAGWLNSSDFNYSRGRYILKSYDGGYSWTETNLPGGDEMWASLAWHAFTAAVNPSDPDKLYVGGKDVWKSNNSGNSWAKVSDWSLMYSGGGEDYVHCDQHIQHYINNSSDSMLYCTDGGIFFTGNASSGNPVFVEKNRNYNTLQFYTCDIYPVSGQNYFVGGLQDNGTVLSMGDPFNVDDMIDVGDGAFCFFDETQPEIMISSTYYNAYTLFQNWNQTADMGIDGTGTFINPADYDSHNNILFANLVKFNGMYSDQILRIKNIPNNPQEEMIPLYSGHNTYFSHVKVSPYGAEGSTTIFLGSPNGRLFRVANANSNPSITEVGSDNFPIANLSSLALGGSEDTLMVTFSNYGVQSVWQTYDGGNNWNDISGNLPDMPIRWALYHPDNAEWAMLATEIGVWTTTHTGAVTVNWIHDAVLPNVRVDMLQVRSSDNTVLAATHGRGLWYATWELDIATSQKENISQEFTIYPNPTNGLINLNSQERNIQELSVLDLNGKIIFSKNNVGSEDLQIDLASYPRGTYLIRLTIEEELYSQKIILK